MTADIIALATQYGRYGYRRITVMLQRSGWLVGIKRVHRIWRRQGLKVPHKGLVLRSTIALAAFFERKHQPIAALVYPTRDLRNCGATMGSK